MEIQNPSKFSKITAKMSHQFINSKFAKKKKWILNKDNMVTLKKRKEISSSRKKEK